jgi:hypothetical protein
MPRLTTIKLVTVEYMPKVLEPGLLYFAEKYGAVAHLCACGCGEKVSTPLGEIGWVLDTCTNGPTLRPSIGNWQLPCQSHYWIRGGNIIWAEPWTPKQIAAGWETEEQRRRAHYERRKRKADRLWRRVWYWLKDRFPR